MTLDPVHVDGIASLARHVRGFVDEGDTIDVAQRAWEEFLDPLYDEDGNVVLEALDEMTKRAVAVEDIGMIDSPFQTQHGLDAGTINPTTFNNGLVVDVSQAALAAVPSDIELHRARTIVMTVHSNDESIDVGTEDWLLSDEGYIRRRILHAPRVDRYEQTVVHALALYRAESEHALQQADMVEDLFVLDGPIYPTGLLTWLERDPELQRLVIEEREFTDVLENYFDLIDHCVTNEIPLVGFVKQSTSKAITRELRRSLPTPWIDDEAFFRAILDTDDDHMLTLSPWFRSRVGTDGVITDAEVGMLGDRALEAEEYEVSFFVVYDPRTDLVYRIEAPVAVTSDEDLRIDIRDYVLAEIARERGPPRVIQKADDLARIDRQGKETLRNRLEREFETSQQQRYNDHRWGAIDQFDL